MTKNQTSVSRVRRQTLNNSVHLRPASKQTWLDAHLRDHQARLDRLMEIGRAILFSFDEDLVIAMVSPACQTLTGYSPSDMQGRPFLDFVHSQDVSRVAETFNQSLIGAENATEFRLRTRAKRYRWFRASLTRSAKRNNRAGVDGLLIDIHDRKKNEEELTSREERYRTIIESIREGYFESDTNGCITFCNQAMVDISGYSRSELLGTNFRDLTPPRTARAMQIVFGRVYKTGQDARLANYEVFHKDGHTLFIEFSASLVKNAKGRPVGFRGILRDVSEQVKSIDQQQRMQNQLYQAQKMEALGTLAGGLAHGFNNVLMAIQGNLSLMRMTLPNDHALRRHLERINQSTDKGVNLAKQILSFAKMGKFVVMTTNLNKILKSTSRMFVRSKPNLRIHEYYEPELWNAQVDRVQIGQLLLSLYMNAAEAMPDGGDLYLQSENVFLEDNQTRAHDVEPGRFIKISVTDSGKGLDEEAIQRIFEPFYSAYHPMRYDGLGLAAVYGTVKSHKGIINVYSEKGHGTTFSIYLPASQRDMAQVPNLQETPRGSETILLVDDDEPAGRVGREILEQHGYKVMMASNGYEAIDIYTDYGHQIKLVLLDIILPDLSGEQVFNALKQINPNVIVVLASGYSVNNQISALLNQGCADFVQKPFQNQSLSKKVRLALNRTHLITADSHP